MHNKGFYFKIFKVKQLVGSNLENARQYFVYCCGFFSFFHFFEILTEPISYSVLPMHSSNTFRISGLS